ncbi:MAG: beta-xylosidase [Flavisolibacter sp.]|nr:beta-xylosidase [Flavisolibacter sp.]
MNFIKITRSCLTIIFSFNIFFATAQQVSKPITIQVDLTKKTNEPLKPIWAWFGYDEPNYTYMKNGKKLLTEISQLSPVPVFVRTHNLLTSGDATAMLKFGSTNAYTEDANGNPIYSWKIVDSIFDTYIERGMKPLAQVGFMPEALSVNPQSDSTYTDPTRVKQKHYTGWSFPPKSYEKYAELVYQWVKHCIQRYGKAEVESWYWELWNEPDLAFYWKGTVDEYIKMYDYVTDAIKRALPAAKVGGPETTNPGGSQSTKYLKTFLDHVVNGKNYVTGKTGSPLDFITFHAKGAPRTTNDTVWMNLGVQLKSIDTGFKVVASYPTLKHLPIIIGESDPEGCAACPADIYPNYNYRNNTVYSSYTAAAFARKYDLAKSAGVNLLGAVTWAFEFENQPWFRGFRDLATNGVDKPVLNVFRMFGHMQGNRVPVISNSVHTTTSVRDNSVRGAESDVNGLATVSDRSASVMVWNYHDKNDLTIPATPVTVTVKGLPSQKVLLTHYLIDQEHSNAYTTWVKMGSPQNPSAEQYAELEKAGQLQMLGSPRWVKINDGVVTTQFNLQRQGVSLIKMTW